jgi:hypothetical protein
VHAVLWPGLLGLTHLLEQHRPQASLCISLISHATAAAVHAHVNHQLGCGMAVSLQPVVVAQAILMMRHAAVVLFP